METRKIMNLFVGQDRDSNIECSFMDTAGEGEGQTN